MPGTPTPMGHPILNLLDDWFPFVLVFLALAEVPLLFTMLQDTWANTQGSGSALLPIN